MVGVSDLQLKGRSCNVMKNPFSLLTIDRQKDKKMIVLSFFIATFNSTPITNNCITNNYTDLPSNQS